MLVKNLILASSSPAREKLLRTTGIGFEVHHPQVDESAIESAYPEQTAKDRAAAKAQQVGLGRQHSLVIGCDQTLMVHHQMLTKPRNRQQAFEQLSLLSGKQHTLFSAIVLCYAHNGASELVQSKIIPSVMNMRQLTAAEIELYLDTNEWQGCVGGYRCEGVGAHLFLGDDQHCMPDQSGIMGLPLTPLLVMLRQMGLCGLQQPHPPWTLNH